MGNLQSKSVFSNAWICRKPSKIKENTWLYHRISDILNVWNRHSRAKTSKITFSDGFLSHGWGTIKSDFWQIFDSFEIIHSHECFTQLFKYSVFDTLPNGCGGSLIEKTAKFASHPRSVTLRFLRWSVISQKRAKIVDVSWFSWDVFSVHFGRCIHSEKSHKNH